MAIVNDGVLYLYVRLLRYYIEHSSYILYFYYVDWSLSMRDWFLLHLTHKQSRELSMEVIKARFSSAKFV